MGVLEKLLSSIPPNVDKAQENSTSEDANPKPFEGKLTPRR